MSPFGGRQVTSEVESFGLVDCNFPRELRGEN